MTTAQVIPVGAGCDRRARLSPCIYYTPACKNRLEYYSPEKFLDCFFKSRKTSDLPDTLERLDL